MRTEIANLDTRLSTETVGVRTEIASLETRLIGETGLELVGSGVIAVLEAVVERLGDDLRLVAVDAASGELLRDGERVEPQGSPEGCRRA